MSPKRNKHNTALMIHPTIYQDYDVLMVGHQFFLEKIAKDNKGYHLIRKSKFGGIPILIIDTCDTLREAKDLINGLKKAQKEKNPTKS